MTTSVQKQEGNTGGQLLIMPEHEELLREVHRLRAEIPIVVLERDNLRYIECRNLETFYMLTLGALEHKAFEDQCITLRLKRKLELIQARFNRQEKIVISQIDQVLDIEFAEYKQKLNEQIKKMNEAIERSNSPLLTKEETKELKKLYYAIVKAMHPDLHPEQTQEEKELFINAIKAYKNGDLDTIRLIYTMQGEFSLQDTSDDATKALYKEKERLEKIIASLNKEIADIKSSFPYTMQELLADKEKIAIKKQELESIIKQYQEMADIYQNRINKITR